MTCAIGHRVTRHVVAAVAVVTLLFAGHARQRVLWKLGAQQSHQTNDFSRWLDMLPRFLREGAPYVDDAFPNPPITLLIALILMLPRLGRWYRR